MEKIGVPVVPLTPCGISSEVEPVLPVHVTPELQDADRNSDAAAPQTPQKENASKKKAGKAGSKRKLFLPFTGLSKAKKLPSAQNAKARKFPSSTASANAATACPGEIPRPKYPQTERQQLQYLLEVTAKDAQLSANLEHKENLCANFTKVRRKDAGKDTSIAMRVLKRNERGETTLHMAAIKGDVDDLVALINAGANIDAKDNAGWSPLHEACNFGHQKIVEKLVEAGADVNVAGYEAITPLHDAVINDHSEVVEFLLVKGADPYQSTNQGYTAFDLAKSPAVQNSLHQYEVLQETAVQAYDMKGQGIRQTKSEDLHSYGEQAELTNGRSLSPSSRTSKPVEQVPGLSSSNRPETCTAAFPVDELNLAHTAPEGDQRAASGSLRSEPISADGGETGNLDGGFCDQPFLSESQSQTCSTEGAVLGSCPVLWAQNDNAAPTDPANNTTSRYLDGTSDKAARDEGDGTLVSGDSVQSVLLNAEPEHKERQNKTGERVSTNTTHTEAETRAHDSTTPDMRPGMRAAQRKKSSRSSGTIKPRSSSSGSAGEGRESDMCVNHTANKTWRATVDKLRYKAPLAPVCLPGYEEFLMHTKSYSLSQEGVMQLQCSSPGQNTSGNNKLKEMKTRHQTEKEKLRLSLEQELVRAFGNASRKSAGYDSPFGACAIVQAQMCSGHGQDIPATEVPLEHSLRTEVEAVLKKFEKLQERTLRRHKHEVDALLALGRLEGLRDTTINPVEATTGDGFELVPRKFMDFYKKVLCSM